MNIYHINLSATTTGTFGYSSTSFFYPYITTAPSSITHYPSPVKMEISIIHEDEAENEIDLEVCCEVCSAKTFGWSKEQYLKLDGFIKSKSPLRLPNNIDTKQKLIDFIKTW